jgi:hypothetical protein
MVAAVLMPRDVDSVAHDDPGAEEPDAGHDVGGDPGRVDPVLPGQQDGEQLEQGGAEGDQGIGAQPGGALPQAVTRLTDPVAARPRRTRLSAAHRALDHLAGHRQHEPDRRHRQAALVLVRFEHKMIR